MYKQLRHFENIGGRFLFNIYLPTANHQTTEIDLLLISPKGLFVFESKNYGGWIFGNEMRKDWMQTFPIGRGRSHKEKFYNPIMQNAGHVRHLQRFIGNTHLHVWSIIVFSDECTLKNVTVTSKNVSVIYRHEVASIVERLWLRSQGVALKDEEINDIYNRLYPYTQVSPEEKFLHIANLRAGSNSFF